MAIVPVARSMYLCDHIVGYPDSKADLYGIFSGLEPHQLPYVHNSFYLYAQLLNGLAVVPFRIDVVLVDTDELLYSSEPQNLEFRSRTNVVQMAFRVPSFRFSRRGRYLFELYCDNVWICDCPLQLK